MKLTDDTLLQLVAEERRQSIGFEHDSVLVAEREKALNYAKGQMPDLKSAENRSQAVSMDIADAIETILPDLIEIFQGGDDVATFLPNSLEDEKQAQQESDYIRHVVEQENDGFLIFYSMFKDALQSKIGVVKFAWEDIDRPDETFDGLSLQEMLVAAQNGTLTSVKINGQAVDLDGLSQAVSSGAADLQQIIASLPQDGQYDFAIKNEQPNGQVKIWPVPPEDFTVARDTVRLPDATYCAFRSRPRAQDLLDQGIDEAIVEQLPMYGTLTDETLSLARDTAGEHTEQQSISGANNLHQVEVIEHFLKLKGGKGGPVIHRVLTGGTESVMIEHEEVDAMPFAAITPYIVTHRFYGESVADKLIEIQKIRTALLRMLLDSGYFALNQRNQVVMSKSNEWTISDLLRNEPGVPIRVREEGAIVPIQSGALSFDVQAALEFMAVQAEQRTGIVRNAQGLNPDTLHDTAAGAMALLAAAQKRVRLIARVFGETGIKDLWLGVHALLRKHASQQAVTKLRGEWVPIDPTAWGERNQMTIEIGLGSAGKVQEIAVLNNVLNIQKEIIQLQQGVEGPLVTAPNVYAAVKKLTEKSGEKNPDAFWTDPSKAQPQQPKPDPKAAEAQANAQIEGQKLQVQQQIAGQKTQVEQGRLQLDASRLQIDQQSAQASVQMQAGQLQLAHDAETNKVQLAREQADRDDRFRYAQLAQQRELEMAKLSGGFSQAVTVQSMKDENDERQREADLTIQASQAADAAKMDDDG